MPKPDRYSLRCALLTAVNEIAGRPPRLSHAGIWQVVYLAIDRLGPELDEMDQQAERGVQAPLPLQLYNNRAGTIAADVISLLEEARERMRTNLRRKPK